MLRLHRVVVSLLLVSAVALTLTAPRSHGTAVGSPKPELVQRLAATP